MAFFSRIHCHFCGTRSGHGKSSGVTELQCSSCEAINYLDRKGNIIDTPATAIAQAERSTREQSSPFQTFTHQLPDSLRHQDSNTFCTTCQHNQRIVMEALSNYLPDDDHPEYQKYHDALPQYKAELEKRYPQICRRCAPKAQGQIHRADYYAGTQNISRLSRDTARGARPRRQRDDWSKWCMRRLMSAVGMMVYGNVLLQVLWHVYGICLAASGRSSVVIEEDTGMVFEPTQRDCLRDATRMQFKQVCYQHLGSYMPRTLLMAACLIWYNPRLTDWFHHTHRIEAITGQTEHFRLQLLLLAIRTIAWFKLSDTSVTQNLTTQQVIAAHGFVILTLVIGQWLSQRAVKSVRFRLKQKMMPRPEQQDVLSAFAGPESESCERQASSIPPSQLFARDHITPFPIANLAPKTNTRSKATAMPSPPPSDETDDEGDPMDVDLQPPASQLMSSTTADRSYRRTVPQKRDMTSNTRSLYNHGSTQGLGWSGMRDSLFGIENNLQARKQQEEQQKSKLRYDPPVEQSPFHGRLPQAPMSMERRLRNPPTQVSFRKAPASKQQDFMKQMRSGIEQGKQFARQQEAEKQQPRDAFGLTLDDTDEDLSPVKTRSGGGGGMELKPSSWHLPTDLRQAQTGLEDMFGGKSFRIDDEPAINLPLGARRTSSISFATYGIVSAMLTAIVAFAWNIGGCRTVICMWLYHKLEEWGV